MSGPLEHAGCYETNCISCADEGVPMRVLRLDLERALALCADSRGARSEVDTALLATLREGDEVLVHAGTAIARLNEAGAAP